METEVLVSSVMFFILKNEMVCYINFRQCSLFTWNWIFNTIFSKSMYSMQQIYCPLDDLQQPVYQWIMCRFIQDNVLNVILEQNSPV